MSCVSAKEMNTSTLLVYLISTVAIAVLTGEYVVNIVSIPSHTSAPSTTYMLGKLTRFAQHTMGNKASASSSIGPSPRQIVEDAVADNPVVIFSKSYCPYCARVKTDIAKSGKKVAGNVQAYVIELDQRQDGAAIQNYLVEKTGQSTVPNVFIGGKAVGGSDDVAGMARSGVLPQMLTQAMDKYGAAPSIAEGEKLPEQQNGVNSVVSNGAAMPVGGIENAEVITLGAGCFWGVELAFQRLPGVLKTEVGYSNGRTPTVTYDAVCTGLSGHAEVVRVWFDPDVLGLNELLAVWEERHDVTSLNKQGNDVGTQYRSAIFTHNDKQAEVVEAWRKAASEKLSKPIASDISPVTNYCTAEDYHQQYLEKKGQSAAKGAQAKIRCYG